MFFFFLNATAQFTPFLDISHISSGPDEHIESQTLCPSPQAPDLQIHLPIFTSPIPIRHQCADRMPAFPPLQSTQYLTDLTVQRSQSPQGPDHDTSQHCPKA